MKIAFVTYYKSENLKDWHSRLYRIVKTLENLGHEVVFIDDLRSPIQYAYKIRSLYYRLKKKNYHRMREPWFAKSMGPLINKYLKQLKPDLIVTPGSLEASYIKTDVPVIIWTDAIFSGLLNYYETYMDLPAHNTKNGHKLEKRGLEKADFLIVPSKWAFDNAASDYGIDTEKISIIEFGSGVDHKYNEEDIFGIIKKKNFDNYKILFVGKKFYDKGCDLTFKALKELNEEGFPVEYKIAGLKEDEIPFESEFLKTYGYLRKSDFEESKQLEKLFKESHFFVMPSRAEAFGIAFIEANSFGLPVIGSKSGGMTTLIEEGKNGFTVNPDNAVEEIKRILKIYYKNREEYNKLSINSFIEYRDRLNWKTAGDKFSKLINEMKIKKGLTNK